MIVYTHHKIFPETLKLYLFDNHMVVVGHQVSQYNIDNLFYMILQDMKNFVLHLHKENNICLDDICEYSLQTFSVAVL
jgi:hypothetical protein